MIKKPIRARSPFIIFSLLISVGLSGCIAKLSKVECEDIFPSEDAATLACVDAFDPASAIEPAQCELLYPDSVSPGVRYWLPLAKSLGPTRFVGFLNETYSGNPRVGCEIGAILRVRFHSKRGRNGNTTNSFTGGGVTIGHPVVPETPDESLPNGDDANP